MLKFENNWILCVIKDKQFALNDVLYLNYKYTRINCVVIFRFTTPVPMATMSV